MRIGANHRGRVESIDYDTICEALDDNRSVTIAPTSDGRFEIREACDGYYFAHLSADLLRAWGKELIAMADNTGGQDQ